MGKLFWAVVIIAIICAGYWMWTHPAQPVKPVNQIPQKTITESTTQVPGGTPTVPAINEMPTSSVTPAVVQNVTKTKDFINMCMRGYKEVDIADCAKCGIIIDPEDYKHIHRIRNVTCILT